LKIGLKVKFVIYLIPLILLICAVFLFFHLSKVDYLVRSNLRDAGQELVRDLSYSSRTAIVKGDVELFLPLVRGILEEQELVLISFYNFSGEVIFAEERKDTIEKRMPNSVLEKLSATKVPFCLENSAGQEEVYDCYAPVWDQPKESVVGYSRVALGLGGVYRARQEAISQSILIAFLVLVLGFFASFFLAERMVAPIRTFIKGVHKIGQGNLNYRFRIKTGDEIEELAGAFNKMTERLQQSTRQLQEAKDVLEIRVKARTRELEELAEGLNEQVDERTKELRQRIEELERFHKLTVGRETRMMELKKELKSLKEKFKKKDV